jgi:hypothetical protein
MTIPVLKTKVQNYALRGEHLLGSKVDLDWSMNYAIASEDKPHQRYIEFENSKMNFSPDLSNPGNQCSIFLLLIIWAIN